MLHNDSLFITLVFVPSSEGALIVEIVYCDQLSTIELVRIVSLYWDDDGTLCSQVSTHLDTDVAKHCIPGAED